MTNNTIAVLMLVVAYAGLILLVITILRKGRRCLKEKGNYSFRFVMFIFWISIGCVFGFSTIASLTQVETQYYQYVEMLNGIDKEVSEVEKINK